MNKPAPMPALIEQHTIADKKTKPVAFTDLIMSGMQLRVSISQEAVARYAEGYAAKADIPAIVVFHDKESDQFYLADGHHRVAAAKKAGLTKLDAIIKQGTILDALLYGARSNHTHGEPLTNDDKRHTVARFLAIPEWRKKSDRWIATAAQVNPHLVAKVRKSLPKEQQSTVRESKDGTTRDTKNIGKAKKQPAPQADEIPDTTAPDLITPQGRAQEVREPELLTVDESPTAGDSTVERSPPPIPDDTHGSRVLKRTREILAERLLKGKDQCTATSEQLVSLGLVVGIPVSADDDPWNDDLVAGCWHKLTVRLQAELADYLTRGETRRLPPLAQLASWWGIDVRAIAIQAERAVGG